MHDGHGGVAPLQEHRGGDADDVGAAHDDGFLARDLDPRALQELDAPARGARDEEGLPAALRETPGVERVESVDVLLVGDGAEDALLVDVVGHRELHQDAVHVRVGVVVGDHLEDLLLGGVAGEVGAEGVDAGLGARLLLRVDVRLGILALADEHHGEACASRRLEEKRR